MSTTKSKLRFARFHVGAMKLLAIATLACGLLAGAQSISKGDSLGEAATVAVSIVAVMSVGLAPGMHTAVLGLIDKKIYLREAKYKASLHPPKTAARLAAFLAKAEEALKPEKEEDHTKKINDLFQAKLDGDVEARAAAANLRITSVDNFLVASTNPIAFFETISLADNEWPMFENTTNRSQEIVVNYLGQDGRARRTQPIKYWDSTNLDMRILGTEEFEYQLWDLVKGNIKDPMLANIDMERDLNNKISVLLWPFIRSQIGAFNLSGARTGRVYFPNSLANVKNLPTSNLLVPPGNSTTTLWRKECMDVVLKYVAAWGSIFPDGAMKPVAVYIPSSEVMGYLDQITLTSNPNSKVEEIFETGFVMTYGGVRWNFVADETLDPDAGIAYVKMNKPIGQFFLKPSGDKVFDDTSIALQKQNKGLLSMIKPVGFGLPVPWRLNIAGVQYHDAR